MQQEKNLENSVKDPENLLKLIDIDEQHERVDASRNIYMPEIFLEQHLGRKLYKNSPIAEIKGEFKFLYNKDKKITDMMLIPTHNYTILKDDKQSAGDSRFKEAIDQFSNVEDIDLIFFRGRYKLTGIPAELRRIGNWFSFKARNEPYLSIDLVRNYMM